MFDKNKIYLNVEIPKDLSGKNKDDLQKLDSDVRHKMAALAGQQGMYYAEAETSGATDEYISHYKQRAKEVGEELNKLRKDYQRLREAQGFSTKTTSKPKTVVSDGITTDERKKIGDDRKRLEEQLENELIKISGDGFKVREDQAKKHYADQVAMAHGNGDLIKKQKRFLMMRLQG